MSDVNVVLEMVGNTKQKRKLVGQRCSRDAKKFSCCGRCDGGKAARENVSKGEPES